MSPQEYFQRRTDERLEAIEVKIDKLLEFKYRILGGYFVISSITALIVTLATIYIEKH